MLPHPRRRARQDARLVGAWLFRDGAEAALEAAPTLRTLVGTDFMEVFLRGVDRARGGWDPSCWAPLAAWRDWSEPPRPTRDALGAPMLPPSLRRREPRSEEVDPRDGVSLRAALSGERDADGWIRKLYLPLHRHFTLVATELLCCAAGTPPIDPARVLEVGCVVRRLVLDPSRERWQDWVVAPDGGGRWVELDGLDEQMRLGGAPLDPHALPASAGYGGRPDTTMRAMLGVTDVTASLSLGITPMSALPPTLGEAGRHTAHYALLPVMTRELQRPDLPPADLAAARKALVDEAQAALNAIFTGERRAALNERLGALWRDVVAAAQACWPQDGLSAPLCDAPWWGADRTLRWKDTLSRTTLDASSISAAPTSLDVVKVLWTLCRARKSLYQELRSEQAWPDGAALSGLSTELDLLPQLEASEDPIGNLMFDRSKRALHGAGLRLEAACDDLRNMMEASSALAPAALDHYTESRAVSLAQELFTHNVYPDASDTVLIEALKTERLTCTSLLAAFGVDFNESLARVFLVCPRFKIDATTLLGVNMASSEMNADEWRPDPAIVNALRPTPPLPRFDPDHVYAARCFARVRGADPCEADQIVWSARTEPYQIADAMDLLGLPPTTMRLPDIPKMIADIPRIAKARATPMVAVTTPRGSGFATGKEPDETRRSFGVAWVCSFGIPVFTICAWVLFLIIFSILILIPGFAWMLLLKFCIPVPAPKRA